MKNSYILTAFIETPWAILPQKLLILEEIVLRHVNGEKMDSDEVQMQIHGAERPRNRLLTANGQGSGVGSVAILPLFGTIFPRGNLMTSMSGATSAEAFGKQFRELVNDPEIGAIVLDVNSPGGQAAGIDELSAEIYNARGSKPVVAVANHYMASAAYWIGTSTDEVVITPSGEVGSIGVFAAHQDISKALEMDGVNVSLISAGKYKVEGNPYQPLTDEARGAIQESVNLTYDAFVEAVARNRGVKTSAVRDGFGQGRMVGSRKALELGMADRIATLDETVNGLLGISNTQGAQASVIVPDELQLRLNAEETSQEPEPVNDVIETQAQCLRDEVSQFLQKKE